LIYYLRRAPASRHLRQNGKYQNIENRTDISSPFTLNERRCIQFKAIHDHLMYLSLSRLPRLLVQ